MKFLRETVRAMLQAAGYRLQHTGTPIRSYKECLSHMNRLGLRPSTVFDVGVADGTPELYGAFPHAKHVLIEPLEEYRPHLEDIGRSVRACHFIAAAGAAPGIADIRVGRDNRKSSISRHVLKGDVAESRRVPVVTLDGLCQVHHFSPPFFIKADVEGAELQVIAGAQQILPHTEGVILEVTVWDDSNQQPELFDVISHMKHVGFVVYDLVGAAMDSVNGGLKHVDLVFVPEESRFRRAGRLQ